LSCFTAAALHPTASVQAVELHFNFVRPARRWACKHGHMQAGTRNAHTHTHTMHTMHTNTHTCTQCTHTMHTQCTHTQCTNTLTHTEDLMHVCVHRSPPCSAASTTPPWSLPSWPQASPTSIASRYVRMQCMCVCSVCAYTVYVRMQCMCVCSVLPVSHPFLFLMTHAKRHPALQVWAFFVFCCMRSVL